MTPLPSDIPERYWEDRQTWRYYGKAIDFARRYASAAESAIDIGARDTRFLDSVNWPTRKTAIDRYFMPIAAGATNVQGDFMKFVPPTRFDLAFCLQVLEHLQEPAQFARKVLSTANVVVLSVPYKWRQGSCKWHVQDPVDEKKLVRWTGRAWREAAIEEDGGARRLVAVFVD